MPWLQEHLPLEFIAEWKTAGYIKEHQHSKFPLKLITVLPLAREKGAVDEYMAKCHGLIYCTDKDSWSGFNLILHVPPRMAHPVRMTRKPKDPVQVIMSREFKLIEWIKWQSNDPRKVQVSEMFDAPMAWSYRWNASKGSYLGIATEDGFDNPDVEFADAWIRRRGLIWDSATYWQFAVLRENRIVKYGYKGLVVLGRTNERGRQYSRLDVRSSAIRWRIPINTTFAGKSVKDLGYETRENFRGYVLSYYHATECYQSTIETKWFREQKALDNNKNSDTIGQTV